MMPTEIEEEFFTAKEAELFFGESEQVSDEEESLLTDEKDGDDDDDEIYQIFSDEEDEDDSVEDSTFKLYVPEDSICPHVDIEVEGVMTTFVVDTGCIVTTVTYEQAELWGLQDKCTPETTEVRVRLRLKKHASKHYIYIKNVTANLLGLDILKRFCCIVDLDQLLLTFRWYPDIMEPEFLWKPFKVAGQDIEVAMDTGAMFMSAPMSVAQKLGLPVEDVSDQKITYVGATFRTTLKYMANDVSISGFGKEIHVKFLVDPEEQTTNVFVVGIMYLLASKLELNEDGSCDISFPEVKHTKYGARIRKSTTADHIPKFNKEEESGTTDGQEPKEAELLQY